MDVISRVEQFNKSLGIVTSFYNAQDDILGYSENNIIYLNTHYKDNLELVNKHETLHFFKNSSQFKAIKSVIFSLLKEEDINKLRNNYYLKYQGLYSEDDIRNGVIDEEIAIDIIIGNGEFPINVDEYVKDAYTSIVTQSKSITFSNEVKRYLNISLSKKIDQQYPKLNKWEKLFVLNYYNGKDKVLPTNKATKHEEVRETIKKELESLYEYTNDYNNFFIDPFCKEVIRKVEMEIQKLISDGELEEAEDVRTHFEENLINRANMISNNLRREYKNIVKVLKNSEYDDAFKYLMLQETISRTYKRENIDGKSSTIVDKRVLHETTINHMVLNKPILDILYSSVDDYKSFGDLYFDSLEDFNEKLKLENSIKFEHINTFGMGKWIKFESRANNREAFIENSQKLSVLVKDTIWCTKTQASSHLEKGDYYVFVDNKGNPHIAIRMLGNEISEVRGIAHDKAQELESEYRKVAIEFLIKNSNIRHGKEWLEKEEWNKRLVSYINKIEENRLTDEDIDNLIYDITEVNDYKIHLARNTNKKILIEKLKDLPRVKIKLAEKYGCKVDEIHYGNIGMLKRYEGGVFPYKVVLGSLALPTDMVVDFSKLEVVSGTAHFSGSVAETLPSLEVIGGDAYFGGCALKSLPKLKKIGGRVTLNGETKIEDLNSLVYIGGDANFQRSQIKSLENLEVIEGNASFRESKISSLPKLRMVKGSLITAYSDVKELPVLEKVGGNADFGYSKLEVLNPECEIIGKMNFANCPLDKNRTKR